METITATIEPRTVANEFAPHAHNVPSLLRARRWYHPAAATLVPDRPITWRGSPPSPQTQAVTEGFAPADVFPAAYGSGPAALAALKDEATPPDLR